MGRYAFFTTGLEYKFRFGVQPSEDIRTFGGVASYTSVEQGYLTHLWDEQDKETIQKEITALLEWIGQSPLDFSSYEKNIDGTWKLKSDLYDLYKDYANEATVARYILGCCIYHQLLYNQSLEADYEG
jgi:hypothetical protein